MPKAKMASYLNLESTLVRCWRVQATLQDLSAQRALNCARLCEAGSLSDEVDQEAPIP